MFDSITGTVVRKDADAVVLAAGGIGYRLLAPLRTLERLPGDGEITLYSHLAVKDDSIQLYGFETPLERDLFLKILCVNGVGARTALSLLSRFPPRELVEILAGEGISRLQAVKGVGARTAKRLVLELKGKVEWALGLPSGETTDHPVGAREDRLGEDLVAALLALGYPRAPSREAALRALAENPGADDLEKLIKTALHFL